MAKGPKIFVTGDKYLDKILKDYEPKVARPAIKKVTKRIVKTIVQPSFVSMAAVDSGSMKAVAKRAGSVKVKTGKGRWRNRFGYALVVSDDRLYQQRARRKRSGGRPPSQPTIKGRPFFYPPLNKVAGRKSNRGIKKALLKNKSIIRSSFKTGLKAQLALGNRKIATQKTIKTRASVIRAAGGFA